MGSAEGTAFKQQQQQQQQQQQASEEARIRPAAGRD